ncbi:ABC transporter ATP-binding protein [Clostridium paraputrificum]|uniref:ABC transporter ATP-binding protein n=1 Tax=Clostridium paraputrificum TaxID=29363 RepID=UPI003D32C3C1
MNEIVVIENIVKVYGSEKNRFNALDDVSLTINEGDFIGIMGPSGSGKSTLLNIIATIDRATTGHVLVGGQKVWAMPDVDLCKYRRDNVGFIFQDCNLLDTLSIRDNILAPLTLAGIPQEECNKRLERVTKRMEIIHILDKFPGECSGGEKQRAAACRALISSPKMIVADEPTGALDTKNSTELLKILRDLNEKEEITIVMVTHDALIASYAKTILLIRDGKIDDVMKREEGKQIDFYHNILDKSSRDSDNFF